MRSDFSLKGSNRAIKCQSRSGLHIKKSINYLLFLTLQGKETNFRGHKLSSAASISESELQATESCQSCSWLPQEGNGFSLSPYAPERDGFGRTVQRQPAHQVAMFTDSGLPTNDNANNI